MKQKEKNLGEPLRELRSLASGYPRFASLIPARILRMRLVRLRRRFYPSRLNARLKLFILQYYFMFIFAVAVSEAAIQKKSA